MKSSPPPGHWQSPVGAERRVPGWAQGVVAALARDQPRVVTRTDVDALLHELGVVRGTDDAIAELRRLGWLVHLGIAGTWTFIPPGQAEVVDPYLGLRAWDRIASPGFHLSGANAAWFLGYLDRASDGKAQILLRAETLLPKGLRASVSTLRCQTLRLPWSPSPHALEPIQRYLMRRRLDLVRWSDGLPCIGPRSTSGPARAPPRLLQALG